MTPNFGGAVSVSASVKYLQFLPEGDGLFPVIVNKSSHPVEGLLIVDGRREWVKVPAYGMAKLPTYHYKEIELVLEKVCI